MEITLTIAIIGCVLSVLSFFYNRKDKSNKDTSSEAYRQGKIDTTLKSIMDKLEKIEKKLDSYDKEIREIVKEEIEIHIKEYHKEK